ncbi:MAG: hypothetical protein Q8J89_14830 [Caulobacter sp.]|nr:hypothetical protein [Caulobacter sp.]
MTVKLTDLETGGVALEVSEDDLKRVQEQIEVLWGPIKGRWYFNLAMLQMDGERITFEDQSEPKRFVSTSDKSARMIRDLAAALGV